MTLFWLLAQAVAGPVLPAPPRPHGDTPCPVATDTSDIVVCARNQDSFRLHPAGERLERDSLPKAELHLGNAALAAETEAAGLPGGVPSNRVMLRLKIPLGAKRKQANP